MENDNIHEISLSAHGYQRLMERTHCKHNQIISFLTKVWEDGKTINSYDKKSKMYRYLTNTGSVGGPDRALRVRGNTLFIFNKQGTAFITCFDIAQKVLQNQSKTKNKVKYVTDEYED